MTLGPARDNRQGATPRGSRAVAAVLPTGRGRSRVAEAVLAVSIAALLVLVALVTGTLTAVAAHASTVEDTFTARLNYARTSHGVPRLVPRDALVTVARAQAARMAAQDRLFHNPNLTTDVTNWRWVGENVGYGPDALVVHSAFMHSEGHRANILDRDFTEVGIGAVVVDGRVWVAEVFRRPMTVTAAASTVRSTKSVTGSSAVGFSGFSHTLRPGSIGAGVRRVQSRLHIARTGRYDRVTVAAVTRFQRSLGWHGCGRVGPRTWSRLF